MYFSTSSLALLASAPLAALAGKPSPGLDTLAKKAGLKYFGAATDSPGQRERAGFESVYPQYDEIMWKSREFGQTTPTNGQKWLFSEPKRGEFNFTEATIVTSLAHKNHKTLRCHALVWHSQLAPWVEETEWTPEELEQVIVDHITGVMGHFKGECYAWDVVNEALNEDGTYRSSVFYDTLGEDFLKIAFRTASKIDPDAKLYYNDYNIESPGVKAEGAQRIVRLLKDEGIRIDGVGLQAHFVAESHPTIDDHISTIKGFTKLGVEVAFTELDVRMQVNATEKGLVLQKEAYKNAVGACVQVCGCVGVTIWDFYDPFSWVPPVFPGQGAALLWFEDFTKHPAYDGVVEALTNNTGKGKGKGKGKKRSVNLLEGY
ncbi:glycoside hydrolase superfamily [Chaetomium sp. MPI-SDFR-AT-0129]|nr:glycoside hydrolase superfamily [Chaetomium sp. MPI-SDFR-AT-0129]